jgi:hypothetical protein
MILGEAGLQQIFGAEQVMRLVRDDRMRTAGLGSEVL